MADLKISLMPTNFIAILLLLLTTLYFIVFCLITFGWYSLREISPNILFKPVKVSIIVAARNEFYTLPLLLSDLYHQEYPPDYFDIIIIDDHSNPSVRTMESVRTYPGHNLTIIELPVNKQGKKEALVEGVRQNHSELLLFTDADCRVQSQWIKTIVQYYCKYSSNCLIGIVDYKHKPGILRNFWRVDLISLVVSGAGTASLGSATLCNGANLAIKRSAYNKVSDQLKMHISSGDDIFILHALKKQKESVITVFKDRKAIVRTNPPETISDFFNQRMRWASKGLNYNDVSTILLALIVFLTNLIMIVTLLLTLTGVIGWILLLILFTLKLIADCLIIAAGLKFFQNMKLLFLIPFYELFYPFYALFITILGISRPYSWKGR